MPNPYRPPRAPTSSRAAARGLPVYSLVCAALAALIASLVVPPFRDALASYGAKLPLLTAMVFALHHGLWLLPVLVLAAWRLLPGSVGTRVARLIGFGGLLLLLPLVIIGMYLPLFTLAATVG